MQNFVEERQIIVGAVNFAENEVRENKHVQRDRDVVWDVDLEFFLEKHRDIQTQQRHNAHKNLISRGFAALAVDQISHKRGDRGEQSENLQKKVQKLVALVLINEFLTVLAREFFEFAQFYYLFYRDA